MTSDIEQIKERLNIVDVIGQYTKLQKSGKNWKGLSPFKKEKTASFFVSPDKGMYYDFSSGQGGDMFTFVEKVEGVDFRGALKMLADRAGVVLHGGGYSRESRDARERHYALMEDACLFYEAQMPEEARAYLVGRGLLEATQKEWRLGFAPEARAGESASWTRARDHLRTKGYGDAEIEQLGIAKRGERGGFYDRFRSRILFPIFDSAGRVIAFSGRIFGEAALDKENAKYLNSPETPLFDKSRTLYGYDRAKNAIRTNNFSILVEGQMDLLMAHQAKYANTVAVSGTGFTEGHLELLARLSPNLVLALDADSAGISAAGRAASLALARGMDTKVAALPAGLDPADAIMKDEGLWKNAVRNAVHIVDFYLSHVETLPHKDARSRLLAAQKLVLPFIARMKNAVDQAHFIHRFSDRFGISEEAVRVEVRRALADIEREERAPFGRAPDAVSQKTPQEEPTPRAEGREVELLRLLSGVIEERRQSGHEEEAHALEEHLRRINGVYLPPSPEERDALLFEAEAFREIDTDPDTLLARTLGEYEALVVRATLRTLAMRARIAEEEGKTTEAETILKDIAEASGRLAELEKSRKRE